MGERYKIKLNDDKLLTGVSTREREKLAKTSKNVNILRELANSKSWTIRKLVTSRPDCPVDILRQLSEDEDKDVRWKVAKNPNTAKDTLKKLSEDENEDVRYRVAKNPNTSEDVLKLLTKDKFRFIREEAKEILKSRGVELESQSTDTTDLSKLSTSQIRNKIFKGSKESRIEALKYALDNINKFDTNLFELVAELNVPYLNDVLETHPNTPDELFE